MRLQKDRRPRRWLRIETPCNRREAPTTASVGMAYNGGMNDLLLFISSALLIGFLPAAVGYFRRLDDWTMTRIWLCLLLPVMGWCVSMALALDTPRR